MPRPEAAHSARCALTHHAPLLFPHRVPPSRGSSSGVQILGRGASPGRARPGPASSLLEAPVEGWPTCSGKWCHPGRLRFSACRKHLEIPAQVKEYYTVTKYGLRQGPAGACIICLRTGERSQTRAHMSPNVRNTGQLPTYVSRELGVLLSFRALLVASRSHHALARVQWTANSMDSGSMRSVDQTYIVTKRKHWILMHARVGYRLHCAKHGLRCPGTRRYTPCFSALHSVYCWYFVLFLLSGLGQAVGSLGRQAVLTKTTRPAVRCAASSPNSRELVINAQFSLLLVSSRAVGPADPLGHGAACSQTPEATHTKLTILCHSPRIKKSVLSFMT